MGDSPREKAIGGIRQKASGINANVPNRFNSFKDPFSTEDILRDVDIGTDQSINSFLQEKGREQEKAVGDVTTNLASTGVTSGSILQDAQLKARESTGAGYGDIISRLRNEKLKQRSGIKTGANESALLKTRLAQNVDFQNLANEFKKLGIDVDLASLLSDDNTLDDILGVLDTASNFIPGGG